MSLNSSPLRIILLAFLLGHAALPAQKQLFVQSGPPQQESGAFFRQVAFSPDSRYMVITEQDQNFSLWDLKTGQTLRRFEGHTGRIYHLEFHPSRKWVLSNSWDGTARIWDYETGKQLKSFEVSSLGKEAAFFDQVTGTALIIAESNKTRVVNLENWKTIKKGILKDQNIIHYELHPSGRYLVYADIRTNALKSWNISTGQHRTIATNVDLPGPWGVNNKVFYRPFFFSPDGDNLYILSSPKLAPLKINFSSGKQSKWKVHKDIFTASFSPDGRYIAWLSRLSLDSVFVLNRITNKRTSVPNPDNQAQAVYFTPDSKQLLLQGKNSLTFLETDSWKTKWVLESKINSLQGLCFNPAKTEFITYERVDINKSDLELYRGTLKVWPWNWNKEDMPRRVIDELPYWKPYELSFSKDGKKIGAKVDGQIMEIIEEFEHFEPDIYRKEYISPEGWSELEPMIREEFEFSHYYSPTGKYFIKFPRERLIIHTLKGNLQSFILPSIPGVQKNLTFCWTRSGDTLITGTNLGNIRFYDPETNSLIKEVEFRQPDITSLVVSKDNRKLFMAGEYGNINVWDLRKEKQIASLDASYQSITALALYANDSILAGIADNQSIVFWDIDQQAVLARLYPFKQNDGYLVTTPEGYFDGNEAGLQHIHYVEGLRTSPIDPENDPNYKPGLLSTILGTDGSEFEPYDHKPTFSFRVPEEKQTKTQQPGNPVSGTATKTPSTSISKEPSSTTSNTPVSARPKPSDQPTIAWARPAPVTDQASYTFEARINSDTILYVWLSHQSKLVKLQASPEQGAILLNATLTLEPGENILELGVVTKARGTDRIKRTITLKQEAVSMDACTILRKHPGTWQGLFFINEVYPGKGFSDLPGLYPPAQRLKTVLENNYGFQDIGILKDPESKSILKALANAETTLKPEDKLIILYSGHAKTGYWCPTNVELDATGEPIDNFISFPDLQRRLARIPCRQILVICHGCDCGTMIDASMGPEDYHLVRLNEMMCRRGLTSVYGESDAPLGDEFLPRLVRELKTQKASCTTMQNIFEALKQNTRNYPKAKIPDYGHLFQAFPKDYEGDKGDFILIRNQ